MTVVRGVVASVELTAAGGDGFDDIAQSPTRSLVVVSFPRTRIRRGRGSTHRVRGVEVAERPILPSCRGGVRSILQQRRRADGVVAIIVPWIARWRYLSVPQAVRWPPGIRRGEAPGQTATFEVFDDEKGGGHNRLPLTPVPEVPARSSWYPAFGVRVPVAARSSVWVRVGSLRARVKPTEGYLLTPIGGPRRSPSGLTDGPVRTQHELCLSRPC